MAQGEDDRQGDDMLYDEDMEDSTMEISLQDIYALSKVDQQTQPAKAATTSAPHGLSSLSLPVPHYGEAIHEPMTVDLEDDLIELDDDILDELTSEVFDEEDYDLVQRNFQEVDGMIDPTLFPDESRADELQNTGVLAHTYEDLFGDSSSLDDDTDPSIDLYVPEIHDPISLSQEDPSEAFASMEELSHVQFADQVEDPESWVDSTSVFSPDAALLQAARGAFMSGIQDSTEHMIEVPILAMLSEHDTGEEDATGMFEVPAELLSQLRQSSQSKPRMVFSDPHEDATLQGSLSTFAAAIPTAIPPFEVDAFINDEGLLVIPPGQAMTSHLRSGMRVRLLVQIIPSE